MICALMGIIETLLMDHWNIGYVDMKEAIFLIMGIIVAHKPKISSQRLKSE